MVPPCIDKCSSSLTLLWQSAVVFLWDYFIDTLGTTWIALMFNRQFTLVWTKVACGTNAAMCWTMTSITTACFPCTITFWTQPIYAFGFIPETLTLFFPLRERWIGSPALAAQSSRNGNHGQVNPPTPSAVGVCASHFSSPQTFETYLFSSATDKQLGGYAVEYDRMTFAIVHGAGHLVPGERPWHALDLLSTFLTGGSLVN